MDFLKLTKSRKTTYEFNEKKVNDNTIKKIIEAGRWSPSCSNIQPWHFIIIKDKEMIKKVMLSANYGDFHDYPSMLIALVLMQDRCPGKEFSCFKEGPVNDSMMCVAMAGFNMVLEATELGVSSALLTPEQVKIKKVLKIRKNDLVPLMIGFGYEKKEAYQKKRVRISQENLVSYEYFGGSNGRN